MARQYLVRIGILGHVGRFTTVDAVSYQRNQRVICRTLRGLEVGEILAPASDDTLSETDGSLIRRVATEDELLLTRLERNRQDAYEACVRDLADRQIDAMLIDVEHLFDGQSLYFYFLGNVPPEVEPITGELADAYDSHAQFRRFTDTLTAGCGPDCGTDEATGCGSNCGSCAIAQACHSHDEDVAKA